MKKMMQTCYPSLQVYYTKFALKSQSNFEDSKKTFICKSKCNPAIAFSLTNLSVAFTRTNAGVGFITR